MASAVAPGVQQVPSFGKSMKPLSTIGPTSNRAMPRPAGPVIGPGAGISKNTMRKGGAGSGFASLFGNSPLGHSASNARLSGNPPRGAGKFGTGKLGNLGSMAPKKFSNVR